MIEFSKIFLSNFPINVTNKNECKIMKHKNGYEKYKDKIKI